MLSTAVGVAGTLAALGLSAGAANAQVTKKATHKDAGYRDSPNGAARCSTCRQFRPPSSCITVESPISADGWCRLFAKAS
ncbi:high potential iron sulfur protein [Rhodopseudomonas sp. HC1]|uniref:high potential iron sulfur protein n=1 Tax=Rhodopseudomonas infernalis TaxID=2897386 RepID=UPI001EE8EAF6|nr:high potential iron sulfur protein [Rhodopseudomonas infernalis]MCG6206508.1 high potential iron sulfur protein [Rhodopseudomonas infernalis]